MSSQINILECEVGLTNHIDRKSKPLIASGCVIPQGEKAIE